MESFVIGTIWLSTLIFYLYILSTTKVLLVNIHLLETTKPDSAAHSKNPMVTLTPHTIRCWQMLKNLPPGLLTSVPASAATNHHITSHQDEQGDKGCCLSALWTFILQSTAGYQVWLAEISEKRTIATQFQERTKNLAPLQWY